MEPEQIYSRMVNIHNVMERLYETLKAGKHFPAIGAISSSFFSSSYGNENGTKSFLKEFSYLSEEEREQLAKKVVDLEQVVESVSKDNLKLRVTLQKPEKDISGYRLNIYSEPSDAMSLLPTLEQAFAIVQRHEKFSGRNLKEEDKGKVEIWTPYSGIIKISNLGEEVLDKSSLSKNTVIDKWALGKGNELSCINVPFPYTKIEDQIFGKYAVMELPMSGSDDESVKSYMKEFKEYLKRSIVSNESYWAKQIGAILEKGRRKAYSLENAQKERVTDFNKGLAKEVF